METILKSENYMSKCGHKKCREGICQRTPLFNSYYECDNCKTVLENQRKDDCCVYCSYGTVSCPSIQRKQKIGNDSELC